MMRICEVSGTIYDYRSFTLSLLGEGQGRGRGAEGATPEHLV
jgi:hypothetical protein